MFLVVLSVFFLCESPIEPFRKAIKDTEDSPQLLSLSFQWKGEKYGFCLIAGALSLRLTSIWAVSAFGVCSLVHDISSRAILDRTRACYGSLVNMQPLIKMCVCVCVYRFAFPDLQQRHLGRQRAAEIHLGKMEPPPQQHPAGHRQRHGHSRMGPSQHEVSKGSEVTGLSRKLMRHFHIGLRSLIAPPTPAVWYSMFMLVDVNRSWYKKAQNSSVPFHRKLKINQ